MDWKQNQAARTLHTLLSQNIRYTHKISILSSSLLVSSDSLNRMFQNIDGEHKGQINSSDLTVFCLENALKFRSKQLTILKDHFGFTNHGISFSQFCQILKVNADSYNQTTNQPSRQHSQLFVDYLLTVVQFKLKSNKLQEILEDQSSQLTVYFTKNMYQDCQQGLTLNLVKQFMYDTNIFSRINFNIIKRQLFSNKKIILQLRKQNDPTDDRIRGRSVKSNNVSKIESPMRNSNVFIDSPLKKSKIDSSLIKQRVDSPLRLGSSLKRSKVQLLQENKPASILKNGKAKTNQNSNKENSQKINVNPINYHYRPEKCQRKYNYNQRECLKQSVLQKHVKKDAQLMIAPKYSELRLDSYANSFNKREEFNIRPAPISDIRFSQQNSIHQMENISDDLDKVHQLPKRLEQNCALFVENLQRAQRGQRIQQDRTNNQAGTLIRQNCQENDISSIRGTKDSFNVNSILNQIENIEKQLQLKRKRNNQKRAVIQTEQTKRSKLVGQIMSRKTIDSNKKTSQRIDNEDMPGQMQTTQCRKITRQISGNFEEQPNECYQNTQFQTFQHQNRKSNFSRKNTTEQNNYVSRMTNINIDSKDCIDVERKLYIENLRKINLGFKESIRATSRKSIDQESRILLPQQNTNQFSKQASSYQTSGNHPSATSLHKPNLSQQENRQNLRNKSRHYQNLAQNKYQREKNNELHGSRFLNLQKHECDYQNAHVSQKVDRLYCNQSDKNSADYLNLNVRLQQQRQFTQNLRNNRNGQRNPMKKWEDDLIGQQKDTQNRRQELLKRASSEAKLKIQEIQRRALERVYSRQNLGNLSKRNYDLKSLQRKMEQTMLKYRSKDKFERKAYQYVKPQREENYLRLY